MCFLQLKKIASICEDFHRKICISRFATLKLYIVFVQCKLKFWMYKHMGFPIVSFNLEDQAHLK